MWLCHHVDKELLSGKAPLSEGDHYTGRSLIEMHGQPTIADGCGDLGLARNLIWLLTFGMSCIAVSRFIYIHTGTSITFCLLLSYTPSGLVSVRLLWPVSCLTSYNPSSLDHLVSSIHSSGLEVK